MDARRRVAVTGIGLISALGSDVDQVAESMLAGVSGIERLTRFGPNVFAGSVAGQADAPLARWCTPAEIQALDVAALFALATARSALADAGVAAGDGVLGLGLGTCNGGIHSLESQWRLEDLDPEVIREYPFYRQAHAVADALELTGPVLTVNTACTAGATAIAWAYDVVASGTADAMLAGGSDPLSLVVFAGFHVLRALSPAPCMPYGEQLGLSLGEGAAMLVLEEWERARARGTPIYAELLGYGLSNDGYHATASDPEGRGVESAVRMALAGFEEGAGAVDYVNTHGTGTKANDVAELKGLRRGLGARAEQIPMSSSKGYFGHTLGAAGALEIATTAVLVKQGRVPAIKPGPRREGTEEMRLVVHPDDSWPVQTFLSTNSAFGGHNSAIVARVPPANPADGCVSQKRRGGSRRVVIAGIGMVGALGPHQGNLVPALKRRWSTAEPFGLKAFLPSLYERRMNRLTQMSIAAAKLALDDAGWPVGEEFGAQTGVLYATARGSLDSTARYLASIYRDGPELASSVDFPNMVLNSTLGKISEKLGLRGMSASFSAGGDEGLLGVGWAFDSVISGLQDRCLVGAGDELSQLSDALDAAEGLDRASAPMTEGALFLALAERSRVSAQGATVYAEIEGWTAAYGSDGLARMARRLRSRALGPIDLVLWCAPGIAGEQASASAVLNDVLQAPVYSVTEALGGYGLSHSALDHVGLAASLLAGGRGAGSHADWAGVLPDPVPTRFERIAVAGSGVGRGCSAILLRCVG